MTTPGWRSLIRSSAASKARLEAALFTTYDRPDDRLLVEHLLPELLGIQRSPEAEGPERSLFFGELTRRLRELSGRLTVFASPSGPAREDSAPELYPWLWANVHKLHVGSDRDVQQHAKLWLLHWRTEDDDQLEAVVSSANLTMSAVRDQLQAGWHVLLPLATPSRAVQQSWGLLPAFLEELGRSAGESSVTEHFQRLLARASCPASVSIVASVPGRYGAADLRRRPWGVAGLKDVVPAGRGPLRVRATVPYVGTWSPEEIGMWCEQAETKPANLQLAWVDKRHPWVRMQPNWRLPRSTRDALHSAGVEVLRLNSSIRFHDQHRAENDTRWSHAKLYHFKRGRAQHLLITSANFSAAAWGRSTQRGQLLIENFELGVMLDGPDWPTAPLDPFADLDDIFITEEEPQSESSEIGWLDASWDGRTVHVRCRVRSDTPPTLVVSHGEGGGKIGPIEFEKEEHANYEAKLAWTDPVRPPMRAYVSTRTETRSCEVRDVRPPEEQVQTPFPELDGADHQEVADRLLLEAYGGPSAAEDEADLQEREPEEELSRIVACDQDTMLADYRVAELEQARALFEIVDGWSARAAKALSEHERAQAWLKLDGRALVDALHRRAQQASSTRHARAHALAAEELVWRLDEFEREVSRRHA